MAINKTLRDKIVAQALQEIQFDRTYKQGKVSNWRKNENLYYGKKETSTESVANVDLGRMQEFVHSLLSKIDEPLVFKFTKRKESQLRRAQRLNALRIVDQQKDDWDIKDLVGKKQAVIYGRAIYSYYADSIDGQYAAHLNNSDVYDFLIDPSGGGIDMEKARNMGDYGVVLDRSELKKGIKDKVFLKTETEELMEGSGNSTESSPEETNKLSRSYGQNTVSEKQIEDTDKFKFWRWFTTYEGQRYYLLLQETGARAIRVEKLEDVFGSSLWPYWSWAAFPDLTEFWTPSYCDYVREIFMAQHVSINQMLDNAERVNKPQKLINVSAIENLAEVKYRRDGYIKVKGDFDVNKALQLVTVPSIDTPLKVFEALEGIQEKASGITAASKGVAGEEKVGIYEGNQANTADRFGLLNKSYSFGYKRFAKLYEWGVREHLNKKVAVDILGPEGVEVEMVSKRDIFRKDDQFGVMIEASDAELQMSLGDKRTKMTYLTNNLMNPIQSPKKSYEIGANIAGFSEDEIKELMDTSEFGDAQLMSEAERDIESLLDGKSIEPNRMANTAYKQKFVDYMQDHQEDIDEDQFALMAAYVQALEPVIMQNMVRKMNEAIARQRMAAAAAPVQPTKPVAPGQDIFSNKVRM